ncbi:hypothetical protein N9053_02700 [bacterium]|nr:hypothetical protein [Rhodopirellula sp.]MDB4558030.1 hypothetical protein [bacterium]
MDKHLDAHNIAMESDTIRLSPLMTLDEKTQRFVGDGADAGNKTLKRQYRKDYEAPELA